MKKGIEKSALRSSSLPTAVPVEIGMQKGPTSAPHWGPPEAHYILNRRHTDRVRRCGLGGLKWRRWSDGFNEQVWGLAKRG